jgi:transcription initiation factor TFIID subunit 5
MGLVGADSSLSAFNQQAIKVGPLEKDKEFYRDIQRALEVQIHSDSSLLQDQVQGVLREELGSSSPLLDAVPFPAKKLSDISAELNSLRDARVCVELGDERLPSICCYTFHNAADRYLIYIYIYLLLV